jgi:hypothetical protein
LELLAWIRKYDSVYELDSGYRPSEKIIRDDEKFDRWFENFVYEMEQNAVERKQKTSGKAVGIPKKASKSII